MLDWLLSFDTALYHLFNTDIANPVFDWVMPYITNVRFWMPVYVLGLAALAIFGGRRGRVCTLVLLCGVLISDSFNSRVVKELVHRPRPFETLHDARVIAPTAGGASFPSSHATNNFTAAFILSAYYARRKWLWYFCAILVAFSRVYVGVHYPLDVLAGAVEGSLIAWMLVWLQTRAFSIDDEHKEFTQ